MGHRPTPSEEAQQLRQATREAHEAMQGLNDLLRQARELAATLTASYQQYHDNELKELANALATEHNQICRDLNTAITDAKQAITETIMAGEAVFDAVTSSVRIRWGGGQFAADQPLPYPEVAPKGPRK